MWPAMRAPKKQDDSESYKVRVSKDLLKAIRQQAAKEERTLHNMMTVLMRAGLESRKAQL